MIILLFILAAYATEQAPDPARVKGFENDVRCLLDKDLNSCLTKISKDGHEDGDRSYLEVACLEKKHPDSCAKLGMWYTAHQQSDKGGAFFDSSCEMKSMLGCWQSIQRQIEKLSARVSPEAVAAMIQEARALQDKICDKDPHLNGQCKILTSKMDEAKKSINFKSCDLEFNLLRGGNSPPDWGVVKQGFPSSVEDCQRFCIASLRELKLENSILRARGQCVYDSKPVGAAVWRTDKHEDGCDKKAVWLDEQAYHRQCYCEQQEQNSFNELAVPFAIFAGSQTSKAKTFGKEKLYRCVVGFYYINPAYSRKDPDLCGRNLQSFKNHLNGAAGAADFDFNFDDLNCELSGAGGGR